MRIYLLSAVLSSVVSAVFCAVLIPLLKRWKAGQNILVYVKEHEGKSGTPTMGGIAFVLATLFVSSLFIKPDRTTVLCLLIGVAYMTIGLLDDIIKKRRKENLGLKPLQKLFFQTGVALFSAIYCLRADLTVLHLPFSSKSVDIGAWMIPLVAFVFLGTVNAVNLTDGLDGLAAGVSVPFFLILGILIALTGESSLSVLSFCLVGSLLGYLLFNVSPAKVFMGDTGSLSLGGFAASIAVFSGNLLYLPVLGICFVFSVISVVIQVIYYKATHGKRVFLMAPLHHHFQEKGHSETRIAYAYFLVTLVIGTVCVAALLK